MGLNETLHADAVVLRELAKGRKKIAEIGTFTGGMSEIIARNMDPEGHLITIDLYKESPPVHWGNDHQEITEIIFTTGEALLQAVNRLERFRPRVTQIIGDSVTVASYFKDKTFDLVFLDGAHEYEAVLADLRAWIPKVCDGGIIAGHDYSFVERLIDRDYWMEHSTMNRDPILNIHFGVARALADTFTTWGCSDNSKASVWWASLDHMINGGTCTQDSGPKKSKRASEKKRVT